jgi:P27 family predicted phage terminase small subunit
MARPGPPPKPTELKLLLGNPGKRPLQKPVVKPTPGATCPTFLTKEAKAEWNRIVPELKRLGLLTQIDRASLASYCSAWSDFERAERQMANRPLTVVAGNGTEIQHPALVIKRAAMEKIRQFAAEFGFTPAARTRVHAPGPDDEKDEDSRFFPGPRPAPSPSGPA